MSDGSAIASVDFYQVGAGSGGSDLLLGSVRPRRNSCADSATGWSISGIDSSGFSGAEQFYAVVTNDAAQTTTSATLTVSEIAVGSFATTPGQYVPGLSLTLSAADLLDWNSGSPTQTVTFYQDTTGSGDFADATELGTGTYASGAWTYTIVGGDTTDWTDPQTFFMLATDADGGASAPIEITVYPDQAPTVGSITAISDTSGSPTTLDLRANGAFDIDGDVQTVDFYATASSSGPFDPGGSGVTHLGSADASTNWTLAGVNGSGLASASETFFAIATDNDGGTSDPVALTLNPVTVDELMASVGEYIAGRFVLALGERHRRLGGRHAVERHVLPRYDGHGRLRGRHFDRHEQRRRRLDQIVQHLRSNRPADVLRRSDRRNLYEPADRTGGRSGLYPDCDDRGR